MRKKIVTLILIAVMAVTLIGCVEVQPEPNPDADPVTLTVYSQLANYSGEMVGWFAQELLERFNVIINIVPDADGVYETRMNEQNLGDIVVWGADGADYKTAVDAGLLFDWEEDNILQEYGPYIWEHMQPALQKNARISSDTDTIYGFGHNVASSSDDHESFFYTWDLRWDLYKALGYPEVNDLDDFMQLMIDMKEANPLDENGDPTYAASLWPDWDGNMVMYVKSMATAYYGYDELELGLYDTENGTFHGALEQGGPYLEMLSWFNQLYRNGLLDPDSATQNFDEMTAKVVSGGTFFSIFNFAGSSAYNTQTHIDQNKIMLSFKPDEATPIAYGMNVMGGSRVWSIGAKSQYPELCMEIINWLCTPEGRMTMEYGPEDVTWYYGEDNKTYATDLGRDMHYDQDTEFPAESGYVGKFGDGDFEINNTTWSLDVVNPVSGERYNWDYWASNQTEARNAIEADWRSVTGATTIQDYLDAGDYKVAVGTEYSASSRSDELDIKWNQVTNAIVDYSWLAIYATSQAQFNFIVNDMINAANDYGYADCLAWCIAEAAARHALELAITNPQ